MWRRTSFNARSHVELTRFIWVRLLMEVGGCFLLMFFFSSGGSASPAARSWKGFLPTARSCCFCSISDWPPSILNLCQWPFCSAKSAPPQDSDFTPVMVGKVGGTHRYCDWEKHFVDIKLVSISFASSQAAETAADIIYRCFLLHISGLNHKKM